MTIKEIAKLANTSPATVSLALNDRPGVSPVTKERILRIAEEQGYAHRRKTPALSPTSGLIRMVAVSKPNSSDIHNFRTSFFAEITNSIQRRAAELGYSMLYTVIPHEGFIQAIQQEEFKQPAQGIILIGTYLEEEEIQLLERLTLPVIVLDRACFLTRVNSIGINNYGGAYQAVKELLVNGHREIGYVHSSSAVFNLTERYRGFVDALTSHGLPVRPEHCFQCNSYIDNGVDALTRQLESSPGLPTAFFCGNDYVAFALISALNRLGLSVPQDVSVVGFDDVPECIITNPQLTTVRVHRAGLAEAAVNRLHELLTGSGPAPQDILVDVGLVRRHSIRSL